MEKEYPLFDRSNEIKYLHNDFKSIILQQKVHKSYFIQGLKGVGKSRIINEYLDELKEDADIEYTYKKIMYLKYTCKNEDGPYSVFQTISSELKKQEKFRTLLYRIFGLALAVVGINDAVRELGKLIDTFRTGESNDDSTKQQQKKAYFSYRKWLERISKKFPIVMYIDNAQAIDEHSLDLIKSLISNTNNKFWGAIIIEADAPDSQSFVNLDNSITFENFIDLVKSGNMEHIFVEPFKNMDFPSKFLKIKYGAGFLTNEANDYLFTLCGGNPGKLIEQIEVFREKGLIRNENGNWIFDPKILDQITPKHLQLIDEIILYYENDGEISEVEHKKIHKTAKKLGIDDYKVDLIIQLVIDISKLNYKMLDLMGPGIIGKDSFLAYDEESRRCIIEFLPKKTGSEVFEIKKLSFDNEHLLECKAIHQTENGVIVAWDFLEGIKTRSVLIKAHRAHIFDNVKKTNDILLGLKSLHAREIPHGFIKHQSIFQSRDGNYLLATIDSKIYSIYGDTTESSDSEVYKAPEILKGGAPTLASDIYAIGVFLYYSLTDRFPFHGKSKIDLLQAIQIGNVEFSGNIISTIQGELQQIIKKCLAFNPEIRYQNADELHSELVNFLNLNSTNIDNDITIANINNLNKEQLIELVDSHEPPINIKKDNLKKMELGELRDKIKSLLNPSPPRPVKYRVVAFSFLLIIILLGIVYKFQYPTTNEVINNSFCVKVIETGTQSDQNQKFDPHHAEYLIKELISQNRKALVFNEQDLKIFNDLSNETENKFQAKYQFWGEIINKSNGYEFKYKISDNEKSQDYDEGKFDFRENYTFLNEIAPIIVSKILFSNPDSLHFNFTNIWDSYINFIQAKTSWEKLDVTTAERSINQAIAKDEDFVQAKLLLAEISEFRNYLNSKEIITEVINQSSSLSYIDSLRTIALKNKIDGEVRAATPVYQELIEFLPFKKEMPYELAEIYYDLCDIDPAITYYNKALSLDSNFALAINHLAYCYTHKGEHRKALNYFKKYVELDSSANSFDSMGDGYFAAGILDSAKISKSRGLEIDPSLNYLYSSLGYINLQMGKVNEAKSNFDNYVDLSNNEPSQRANGYFYHALAEYYLKNFENAKRHCEKGLNINTSTSIFSRNHELHWFEAFIASILGNSNVAQSEIRQLDSLIESNQINPTNYHKIFKYRMHLEAELSSKSQNISNLNKIVDLFDNDIKTKVKDHTSPFDYPFFSSRFGELYLSLADKLDENSLQRKSLLKSAEKCFRNALDFTKNYPQALIGMTKYFEMLNNNEEYISFKSKLENQFESADAQFKGLYLSSN